MDVEADLQFTLSIQGKVGTREDGTDFPSNITTAKNVINEIVNITLTMFLKAKIGLPILNNAPSIAM